MADLKEEAVWEPGIYQLEESDPVIGGPNGIDNLQAKQLGNRTQFLNKKLSEISDKFQSYDLETLVRSPKKLCHIVLRDNSLFGIYSYDIEKFKWFIDENGVFSGHISANNVNGINELIKSKLVFNSSTDSTAEDQVATPLAVKKTYDLASVIIDSFRPTDFESVIFSPDKMFHAVVRNDGVVGLYNS
ncbi:tail fiber protein, partial [Gilliamella sp. B2969]|uniref:phage tail protein n=1 Tax=Gilliamella sp. B2969 TaxID=2818021 RepID=UPI00226ADE5F